MICAVLAAQVNTMIANAEYTLYSKGQYGAAQTGAVDHDQKRKILESKGLISAELAKNEKNLAAYADAANACVVMIMRSEAQAQKLSEKDRLDVLISAGIVNEKQSDIDMSAGISVGDFADMCIAVIGYNYLEPDAVNAVKQMLSGSYGADKALTGEMLTDILYMVVNLPICVVDSWEYNAATNTQTPVTVMLDGSDYTDEKGAKQRRDYVTVFSEMENAAQEPVTAIKPEEQAAPAPLLDTSQKISELQRLGVIAYSDDLRLGDSITRAEISKILAVMLCADDATQLGAEASFFDVPAEHWAFNYVETLSRMGVIDGVGQGLFAPEGKLTFAQMCKLLVCAAGYSQYAEVMGGYPDGYIAEAEKRGITNGINAAADDELTREQTMMMAYNTLDIPLCTVSSYEFDEFSGTYAPVYVINDGSNGHELLTMKMQLEEKQA